MYFLNLVKNKFCLCLTSFVHFSVFETVSISPIQWFGSLRLYDPFVILLGRNYICVFFKKKLNFLKFFLHTLGQTLGITLSPASSTGQSKWPNNIFFGPLVLYGQYLLPPKNWEWKVIPVYRLLEVCVCVCVVLW